MTQERKIKYLTDEFPETTFVKKPVPRYGPWGLIRGQSPTGYGRKIPTDYMAVTGNRTRRVYCCIYSNAGTCYVLIKGEWYVVKDFDIPEEVRKASV